MLGVVASLTVERHRRSDRLALRWSRPTRAATTSGRRLALSRAQPAKTPWPFDWRTHRCARPIQLRHPLMASPAYEDLGLGGRRSAKRERHWAFWRFERSVSAEDALVRVREVRAARLVASG